MNAAPTLSDDGAMIADYALTASKHGYIVGAKVNTLKKVGIAGRAGTIPSKGLCTIVGVSASEDKIGIQVDDDDMVGGPSTNTTTIANL